MYSPPPWLIFTHQICTYNSGHQYVAQKYSIRLCTWSQDGVMLSLQHCTNRPIANVPTIWIAGSKWVEAFGPLIPPHPPHKRMTCVKNRQIPTFWTVIKPLTWTNQSRDTILECHIGLRRVLLEKQGQSYRARAPTLCMYLSWQGIKGTGPCRCET